METQYIENRLSTQKLKKIHNIINNGIENKKTIHEIENDIIENIYEDLEIVNIKIENYNIVLFVKIPQLNNFLDATQYIFKAFKYKHILAPTLNI